MQWLSRTALIGVDNELLASELELLKFLKEKTSQSNSTVKKLAKKDIRARLLQSIPGIGPALVMPKPSRTESGFAITCPGFTEIFGKFRCWNSWLEHNRLCLQANPGTAGERLQQ